MENKKSRKINPIMHEGKACVNVVNAWTLERNIKTRQNRICFNPAISSSTFSLAQVTLRLIT